jgi:hypothetical protein
MAAAGAPTRELTFAQELERPSPARKIILGAIGAAALIGVSFVWWARSAGTPQAAIPAPPARPASLLKMPSGPLPVPSQEEIDALFPPVPVRPAAPAPQETPDEAFTPVAPPPTPSGPAPEPTGPGTPPSGDSPDNSH